MKSMIKGTLLLVGSVFFLNVEAAIAKCPDPKDVAVAITSVDTMTLVKKKFENEFGFQKVTGFEGKIIPSYFSALQQRAHAVVFDVNASGDETKKCVYKFGEYKFLEGTEEIGINCQY